MKGVATVTAFVDWKSQVHVLKLNDHVNEDWFLEKLFERLFKRIVRALSRSVDDGLFYKIEMRLYHGWYKGFQEQAIRKSVRAFVTGAEFAVVTQSKNAVVNSVSYGDTLFSAKMERAHKRLGIHLPNTFRNGQSSNKPPYEKMVDTALGADLLVWASQFEFQGLKFCDSQIALVLGEDDDLWPPVLAAEQMWLSWGGQAFVVQDDLPSSDMPNVIGLVARN